MSVRLARPRDFTEAIAEIDSAPHVGVDTEFHAEGRWIPQLFLLQVHVPGGTTWLFDPLVDGGIRTIGDVLCGRPWVVHAGHQDMRILHAWFGRLPEQVLDTQVAAGLLCERFPEGYASLVQRYLGSLVEKKQRLSDWSARPLTEAQIDYAAADVLLLFDLWERLESDLRQRGRLHLVQEACRERRAAALQTAGDGEAWRGLNAVPALDDDALKAVRALSVWRRRLAIDRDSQERSVIGDGLLVQLSKARPATLAELKANRRMPKSVVRRYGADIVRVVGEASSQTGVPLVARYRTAEWRTLAWLECYAQALGREGSWASDLVLPRRLIESLATRPPRRREELTERLGWRDELVGDQLWAGMAGEVALGLDGDVQVRTTRHGG